MVRALLAGVKTQTRRAMHGPLASARNRFGEPGDLLWVRETFFAYGRWETRFNARKQRREWAFADMTLASGLAYRYEADGGPGAAPHARREADAAPAWHKRPALFMPRVASRIVLEIVEVRIERLREIGAGDALAEGLGPIGDDVDPVLAYRAVWERINGVGSWDADPLVWVVAFRRLTEALVPPTGIEPVSHA